MLCLRAARQRAARHAAWLAIGVWGLVSSACGALLLARSLRAPSAMPSQRAVAVAAVAEARSAADSGNLDSRSASPSSVDQAENKLDPAPERGVPVASAISSVLVPPATERAPSARVPTSSERLAASHATPVAMFSTRRCPHCQRARRVFRANRVSVTELDINRDARAAVELMRRTGGKTVPLDVDGHELKGFDERAAIDAIVACVERRLGVTGLRLSAASVPARSG